VTPAAWLCGLLAATVLVKDIAAAGLSPSSLWPAALVRLLPAVHLRAPGRPVPRHHQRGSFDEIAGVGMAVLRHHAGPDRGGSLAHAGQHRTSRHGAGGAIFAVLAMRAHAVRRFAVRQGSRAPAGTAVKI